MAYSSSTATELKAGYFDRLQAILNGARYGPAEAYVLQVKKEDELQPLEDPRIKGVIKMKRCVDIIVFGTDVEAGQIAEDMYIRTGQPVGIAKYDKDSDSTTPHRQAGLAREIAQDEGKRTHLYDPSADSLDLLL